MNRIRRFGFIGVALSWAFAAHAQISGFGGTYTLNNNGNGSATILDANTLQLTDANSYYEANSVFNNTQQNITGFTASFTYQLTAYNSDGFSPADGFTFVVQNDSLNALGVAGADLGYSNSQDNTQPAVENSVALAFNLYVPNGPGENMLTDGNNPFSYNPTDPVSLGSEDPINVVVTYTNGTLSELLTDAANPSLSYSNSYNVDIAGTLGSNMGWVGFTAANASGSGTQVITNFEFTPTPAPEPISTGLLVFGAATFLRRRNRSS